MPAIYQKTAENSFEARVAPEDPSVQSAAFGIQVLGALDSFRVVATSNVAHPLHLLIADPGSRARVNGQSLVGGLCVLDHKDEITEGDKRYYFSAESQPQVVVYQCEGAERTPRCPVCRGPINNGDQVVLCPGCRRVYHQIDADSEQSARPCWTYAPACQFCQHPTSLSGETGWRPEKEDL